MLQAAYPERVAQIHVINSPLILHALMSFFRPFLKEKIRKRVSNCLFFPNFFFPRLKLLIRGRIWRDRKDNQKKKHYFMRINARIFTNQMEMKDWFTVAIFLFTSSQIMVHSSLESLYEYVPKSHLPKDYGGECADKLTLNCEYLVLNVHIFFESLQSWYENLLALFSL